MKPVFVDANVFLRFFTRDDAGHHERAARLFRAGEGGSLALVSGPPVLFEIAWTLRVAYRRNKAEVLDVLEAVLAFPGLTLTDAAVCREAIQRARTSGTEFADAYIAALASACGAGTVATFNLADFRRLGAACHAL
jgi:predicted nucleic acid-binding protein